MYEQFFGLSEKPFSIQPDPSFLYWGRTHRLAYAMLEYGVLNHAGISVITGEVGCGKTTLVHRLLDQLSNTHTVALLSNIQDGRGDLLSWVLMGFGEPFADKSHVELFAQLQNFFISEYAKGRRVVLIIDEAQNLSTDMLEELRMLSNINAGKDQLLQLILVGQPQLKDLLNKPELLQLAQRVGSDFHLTPLNKEEVHAYIETRLAIAGCNRRVFTDRAIDVIADQSRGVPRVINIITDTALVYAFSAEELVVGVETIRNVVRDKTEFGVFGLASDEKTAPPIRPSEEGGIDSFTHSKSDTQDPDRSSSKNKPVRSSGGRKKMPSQPPRAEPPLSAPQREAKSITDIKANIKSDNAPVLHPEAPARSLMREESSVTGVVVVATSDNASPEAAIRSAGDGRAIVFVATENARDLISVARKAGAIVVEYSDQTSQSGGRARNAGYRQLKKIAPHINYVQFVEADYALDPDWISSAERFMSRRPEVSVIEGYFSAPNGKKPNFLTVAEQKRREIEGEIQTVGGKAALMRAESFEAAGGFRGDLLSSETEDLCIRLRRRGGRIWRLDATMSICEPHASAIGSWWIDRYRTGKENAYCASLHGRPPERLGVGHVARSVIWGLLFPLAIVAIAIGGGLAEWRLGLTGSAPWFVGAAMLGLGFAIYLFKMICSAFRRGPHRPSSWRNGFYATFSPFPEFFGACRLWLTRKR